MSWTTSILKDFAKLFSASAFAQIIGFLVYPLLTRLYTPEDFGLLHLFLSIGSILVIIANAEWHYAVVLEKDDQKAITMVQTGIRWLLLIVIVVACTIPFSGYIAQVFNTPSLANWYWLIPVFILSLSGWNILNYWLIRRKKYDQISGYQYTSSLTTVSAKLCFGYGGILRGGLILSSVIGQVVSLLVHIWIGWKDNLGQCIHQSYNRQTAYALVKHYRNFPCYKLPRTLINYVVGQAPIYLLAPAFGEAYIGYLGMAILVGFTPIALLSKAFYQVLYRYVNERIQRHESLKSLFQRFTGWSCLICIPLFVVLYYMMPTLVTWIFGANWLPTADILRWMLPWVACALLTNSTHFIFDVFFKQKLGLGFELLLALCRCIGLAFGMLQHSFMLSIIGYCLGSAIAVIAQYIGILTLVWKYEHTPQ